MGRSGSRKQAYLAASDSSDEEFELSEQAYATAGLTAALRRAEDYCAAVRELEQLLSSGLYGTVCTKGAQAAVLSDVASAIACCCSSTQHRRVLAALMEAVERHLPQAKRKALLGDYKKSSMALRRREKKGSSAAGWDSGDASDDDASEPATFEQLPMEVVGSVFRYLDPLSLARAACVCSEWRACASGDDLWAPLLGATFGPAHHERLLRRAAAALPAAAPALGGQGVGSSMASAPEGAHRLAFALGAQRHPSAVLVWRTNRVLRNGRLYWLTAAERQALLGPTALSGGGSATRGGGGGGTGAAARRLRHLSPQDVVRYWQAGGRLQASPAESSCSASDSEGGSEGEGISARLKFWRVE